MNKNKIISTISLVLSVLFIIAAVVGVVMGCSHALILLAPAIAFAIYPTLMLIKTFKNKLAIK